MPSPSADIHARRDISAATPDAPSHKPAFVGRKVVVHGSLGTHLPIHMRSVPLDCPDVAGGLICLRCPETDKLLWLPVDGMAWIELAE